MISGLVLILLLVGCSFDDETEAPATIESVNKKSP